MGTPGARGGTLVRDHRLTSWCWRKEPGEFSNAPHSVLDTRDHAICTHVEKSGVLPPLRPSVSAGLPRSLGGLPSGRPIHMPVGYPSSGVWEKGSQEPLLGRAWSLVPRPGLRAPLFLNLEAPSSEACQTFRIPGNASATRTATANIPDTPAAIFPSLLGGREHP